ncbi:MAG TPA: 2-C-methyl-D-erythritol 4-phosphate cytidylyltransferase [Ktedonobacteraceae bacterium]|jgi:2-C-methyl-D-erythritol 4-phosphate cytidylyltransferase|nr:2-C-methyl-D-erythritol 4-phosphate cytidylyltransferase [Ktedonobacteraceae bacterium]
MQEQSAVVIVAAGASRRMGRDKLWIPLAGRIVLARTVDVFQSSPLVDAIVLVTSAQRLEEVRALCEREQWQKVVAVVPGGNRRQDSVCCGLDTLAEQVPDCRWVMVHDAARPFVDEEMIAAGLRAAQLSRASIAAVPVKDTIKQVQDNVITATPDRSQFWMVQTPQVFSFPLIHHAHHTREAQDDMTDDATLLERLGETVTIFPGAYTNIKVTTEEDVIFAEALLQNRGKK